MSCQGLIRTVLNLKEKHFEAFETFCLNFRFSRLFLFLINFARMTKRKKFLLSRGRKVFFYPRGPAGVAPFMAKATPSYNKVALWQGKYMVVAAVPGHMGRSQSNSELCLLKKLIQIRAVVVVAQLVERSLPTPEIHSSNPDIGRISSTNGTIEKTQI